MEIEDLLKPRYKVINDYPDSILEIDEVLETQENDSWQTNKGRYLNAFAPSKYPSIFKKLEWHEERNVEDMPEYIYAEVKQFKAETKKGYFWVQWKIEDGIYKCRSADKFNFVPAFTSSQSIFPATKKEYEQYLKQTPTVK